MNRLLTALLLLCSGWLSGQPMEVLRTKTVERNAPVHHIFIDQDNVKWVLNKIDLYQVLSADFGEREKLKGLEKVLSGYAGGKVAANWPTNQISALLGDLNPEEITAGFYESSTNTLWIGTEDDGVFQIRMDDQPQLAGRINTGNSKLRTDEITFIYIDPENRKWIGSTAGLLIGDGRKWKMINKDYDIKGIATFGQRVVFVGDEWLWNSENGEDWDAMELPPRVTEGQIVDVAFDSRGRLWIASEIISRYDEEADSYDLFGGPEDFTSEFVNCIAIDQEDALWVGTEDKGLFLIDKKSSMSVVCKLDRPLSCDGKQKDAALKVIVSGGLSPYSYQWSGGQEGPSPDQLGAGTYIVTVTDSKGKSKTAQAVIEKKELLAEVLQEQMESADGAADGAASVSIQGGTGDFTYQWDNGEKTARATQLTEGLHTITITDNSGCTLTASLTIGRKAAELTATIEQTAELPCPGSATAALRAVVSGGQPPYRYQWSNNEKGETIAGLKAGVYQVSITDGSGQQSSGSIEITEPDMIVATAEVDASATANNEDGRATVKAKGGKGKYTYRWDTGETGATAEKLGPGSHVVTVTDESGCTATAAVEITEDILPLQVSLEQSRENPCPASEEAAIAATVKGGKSPFNYQWNRGGATTPELSGLAAGQYELTVTDASGLSATAGLEVKDPEAITLRAEVAASATANNEDGRATVEAKGGKGKYTYRWDTGETGATAEKLGPGSHVVTVTDESGCTATATVEITEDILPLQVSLEQSRDNPCPASEEAAIAATVKGGKSPFNYQWNRGGATTPELSGLAAGQYELTVTDASGLSATAGLEVKDPEAITLRAEVAASATANNEDGRATVEAKGGKGKYTYRWDTGETGATAEKLGPGSHAVTVTDESGCTATATVEITEDILPLQVSLEQSRENPCPASEEAAIAATVKGGKSPFNYQWNRGGATTPELSGLAAGQYELTVTDASGLSATAGLEVKDPEAITLRAEVDASATANNEDGRATVEAKGGKGKYTYRWDTGETGATAEKLGPGSHVVTVTDESGCTATAAVEITENILPLQVSLEQSRENPCPASEEAAIAATVKGGKSPFNYQWNRGGATTPELSGLAAGQYELTVTDASGLSATAGLEVKDPEAITLRAEVAASATANNEDGRATVKAKGGKGKYTYRWDTGETGATAEKLGPGSHAVTVTDESGCTATATVEITEDILPLQVSLEQSRENPCPASEEAAIAATVKGGKSPFNYQWNRGGATTPELSGLAAGQYELTVTDASGLSATAGLEVKDPEAITLRAEVAASATANNEDGRATVEAKGGKGKYTYRWDTGETGATAEKLGPGSHAVTVTDESGCTATAAVEITEDILPLALTIEKGNENKCFGDSTASLKVVVEGGKTPFTYSWNDKRLKGTEVTGLKAGDYSLTVTDITGQEVIAAATVSSPEKLEAEITKLRPATNDSRSDGRAALNISGGTTPYQILWDGEAGEESNDQLSVGNHQVLIADANQCQQQLSFETKVRIIPQLTESQLRRGQTVKLERLTFDADSTRLNASAEPVLDELFLFLEDNPNVVIEVGGHTNNIPEHDFCDRLSTARAKSVADYIVQKGVNPNRVYYKGYGKRKPIESNRTREGRKANQRVEIKILKIDPG